MQDRVPLYPGRVRLTPVSGQENIYDIVRSDEPTQEGDPLSKVTFLKDATAALYGLGTDAVPDDVLAWIGKYNQYWWRRTEIIFTAVTATTATSNLFFNWTNNYNNVISYSDSFSVNDSGKVVLVNPSTLATSNSGSGWTSTVLGKYVTGCKVDGTRGTKTDDVYFIPSSAVFSYQSTYSAFYTNNAFLVTANKSVVGISYVTSGERDAYPDSGISGGYEYQYLGIPFNNAVEATVKIATGSYTGTGTYGSSNPNSLTFDFEPKIVFIGGKGTSGVYATFPYVWGGQYIYLQSNGTTYSNNVSISGNTMTWYSSSSSASYQLNTAGTVYNYIAIG